MKPYYEDAKIRLFHGDAREVLPAIGPIEGGCLVTDPPYGMRYESGWSGRSIEGDEDTKARDDVLRLWSPRPAIVFGRWDCPRPSETRALLVWDKGDWPGMGDLALPWGPSTEEIYILGEGFTGKRSGSVLRYARMTGATLHPNEKPVGLMKALIQKCPPTGLIVDPFAGSGTTLRAAKDMGRSAIGVEKDERHCEIAALRLRQEVLAL